MHTKTITALTGFCIGVVVGLTFLYATEIACVSLLLALLQAGIMLYEKRVRRKEIATKSHESDIHDSFIFQKILIIFFLFLSVGILRTQFIEEKNSVVCEQPCSIRATISSSPKIQNEYQLFSARVEDAKDAYDVMVRVPLYPRYAKGEDVVLSGKITAIKNTYQHHDKTFFDYRQYLRIHVIGSEMIFPKIEYVDGQETTSLTSLLELVRQKSIRTLSLYIHEPSASLATGMLFGASLLSKELLDTFRVAGLSHIVVVSGFNLAVLISLCMVFLYFLPLTLRILLSLTCMILFVVMVGAEAGIVRASIMTTFALIALLLGREYVLKQALLMSLLCIVLYSPESLLYDVSLHLSFLATAGIVYLSEGIASRLHVISSQTYKEIIATTCAAYIATFPYVLYTFSSISLYALLTNIIVLPLVPLTMILSGLTLFGGLISIHLAQLFGYLTTHLGMLIISIARVVEGLPFASYRVESSLTSMITLYVTLIVIYWYLVRSSKNETLPTKVTPPLSEIISY